MMPTELVASDSLFPSECDELASLAMTAALRRPKDANGAATTSAMGSRAP